MAEPTKAQLLATVAALESRLAAAERAVTGALEQEKATSEILRVISRAPSDISPVFAAIAESAARVCAADDAAIVRLDERGLLLVAHHGPIPPPSAAPFPATRETVFGRTTLEREPIHVVDLQAETEEFPLGSTVARELEFRTILGVPLLREKVAIGAICIRRTQVQPFTDEQVAQLQTFADQAVIAIENARLLTELQEKNDSLTQALEQQTATAEVLRVISSSATEVQPVFDTIAQAAMRLCDADSAGLFQYDGELIQFVAHHGRTTEEIDAARHAFPQPARRQSVTARALLDRAIVHIPDVSTEAELAPALRIFRTVISVPLMRDGRPLGAITLSRRVVHLFSDAQIVLLQTFADQAVIAIENVRLFTELQASNRELTTALDQQTATSDILRVISRSQTDVKPVFDTIVRNAARLCQATSSWIWMLEEDRLAIAAPYNVPSDFPMGIHVSDAPNATRVIREGIVFHVSDSESDPRVTPAARNMTRALGARAFLMVPMKRDREPIGALTVLRSAQGTFSDNQIDLLKTFADQAVIAVENARLLTELQQKNESLTKAHAQVSEALEQQTATSEILRVISSSPTDVQPVFDTIARNAVRLCGGVYSTLYRVEGKSINFVAHYNFAPDQLETWRRTFPRPVEGTGVPVQRVVRTGAVYRIGDADVQDEGDVDPATRAGQRARGLQSLLLVPMFRQGEVIGAIGVTHRERNAFTDAHVELLKTFADQAVIAIENVRLFTELQASNRELTAALDTQTATSDILRVISRSQTDVQPVFDAIVTSAVRLLGGYSGALTRLADDQIHLAALTHTDAAGDAALRTAYPCPLHANDPHAYAIRDRAPINIVDFSADVRWPEVARARARARGWQSMMAVPLLRHDAPVGAITVSRRELGGFTADEIALLKTFADQAVIAIENARLLTELQARTQELTRSVGELQALGEVGQAISSTLDLQTVLRTIVARATQLADADAGVIYEYDEQREVFEPRATERLEDDIVQTLVATPVRKGQGATGRLAEVLGPIQLADLRVVGEQIPVRDSLIRAGYRALLAVPLVREDHLIGGLTVFRKTPGEFAADIVDLLKTFATQSSLAIQNARLFREIAQKSRELEVASQHKSEFLASMSHELRTPLNAIIGFSDVLLQGMFGEMTEKQTEYLQDILASGQHLLSLINDILDLSKIEAGRMELDPAAFDLPTAIDDALLLMRERAGRRGITLERHVDERLGEIRADQRKVKQVLLNLLSNAVKFTPEGGRIDVRAGLANGTAEISVTDTGIGIAPEDHDAVFEEFRQVGAADKKAEGTGLGLALCRKFIDLHGGRIWVKSQIGAGSTFTFTLPLVK